MKQSLLLLGVALLMGSTARADFHCEQPTVATGEVRSGAALSHRFALVNDGTETVEILDLKPSCGCLTPRVDKRVFAPGARGQLLLEVNTLTQAAGPQSWRVTVHYRDGQEEHELVLQLAATIVYEVSVTPPALVLITTTAISHEITLTDRRKTALNVTTVQTTSPHLRARLGDWQRNDDGHFVRTITLDVLADYPEGKRDETLQIFTADPEYRELKIPVTITKRAKRTVSASPDVISEISPATEAIPSRAVMLRAVDDQDVVVERVESDMPAILCEVTKGPGHRATLKIQIDRKQVTGDEVKGTLRVQLRQPAGQTVTIPVTWTLK